MSRRFSYFGSTTSFVNTKSVLFDGVNEYTSLAYDANIAANVGSSNSYSFWFKTTAGGTIISNLKTSAWEGFVMGVYGGFLSFDVRHTSPNRFGQRTTASVADGNWHHVVVTYNGSVNNSGIIIYIDGSAAAMTSVANTTITAYTVTDAINIGRNPAFAGYYAGNLDEMTIYSSVLTSGEVTALYNSGCPPQPSVTNLLAYWRMGDGDTFPTLTDNEGSNNGTMVNMESGDITSTTPC